MLKIMVSQWDKNKEELRRVISERTDMNRIDYKNLVKLTFETIYNNGLDCPEETKLDIERVHEIDDGSYQGTLLFLIPFDSYQPNEYDYLMTYVGYGSCSGCDALQHIQDWCSDEKLSDRQVKEFMALCKDILTNTIKPYNEGWRHTDFFDQVEEVTR